MYNTKALSFVEKLGLQPHPEGGWYKETYRSNGLMPGEHLPAGFTGPRCFSTAIYFLLEGQQFSAFHRIKSDELWHFYYGDPINIYNITENGTLEEIKLGNNVDNGEVFQAVVPAGRWFASQPANPNSFALVGCTVAPGFDFADFEMAKRADLLQEFPQHSDLIMRLTRE